jgi:hypothetical protein
LRVSSEAENGGPQLQNKRGRLTTLRESNEAENGGPKLQNKKGLEKENFNSNKFNFYLRESEQGKYEDEKGFYCVIIGCHGCGNVHI